MRMPRANEPVTYPVYNPSVQAFSSVSAEEAKLFVEAAEKLKKLLIEDGVLEA